PLRGVLLWLGDRVGRDRAARPFPTRRSSDLSPAGAGSAACRERSRSASTAPATAEVAATQHAHARLADHAWSAVASGSGGQAMTDRKSTRLNSSHVKISYAVFCLKKKRAGDT